MALQARTYKRLIDWLIDLRGHSLLYNDVLLTFKPAEATFSAPKIGIFEVKIRVEKKSSKNGWILTPKNAYF